MKEALLAIIATIDDAESKLDLLTQIFISTSCEELSRICEDYRNDIGALDELI
jgi:hypothetical protein